MAKSLAASNALLCADTFPAFRGGAEIKARDDRYLAFNKLTVQLDREEASNHMCVHVPGLVA